MAEPTQTKANEDAILFDEGHDILFVVPTRNEMRVLEKTILERPEIAAYAEYMTFVSSHETNSLRGMPLDVVMIDSYDRVSDKFLDELRHGPQPEQLWLVTDSWGPLVVDGVKETA